MTSAELADFVERRDGRGLEYAKRAMSALVNQARVDRIAERRAYRRQYIIGALSFRAWIRQRQSPTEVGDR